MPFLEVGAIRQAVRSSGALPVREALVKEMKKRFKARTLLARDISFRELWEAFVGPAGETLQYAREMNQKRFVEFRSVEAVNSAAFSFITGNVIMQAFLDGYEMKKSVLDKLVTPMKSTMRSELVVGFSAIGGIQRVDEGAAYDDSVMTEKGLINPEPEKRGRAITITQEAILFDQTGRILSQARSLGEKLKTDREAFGIRQIQDLTDYYCYYPVVSGVGTRTALYRTAPAGTAWYNRSTNALTGNALVDWTDITAAWELFAAMKDEQDDNIIVSPNFLLLPIQLMETAARILNATEVRKVSNTDNTTIGASPHSSLIPGDLDHDWSPFMNDTSTWYFGDFKSQFNERIIIPPQTVELPPDPRRDIVAGFVVKRKSQVEAVDDKFVVRSGT